MKTKQLLTFVAIVCLLTLLSLPLPFAGAASGPTAEKPLQLKYASSLPPVSARHKMIFEPWCKMIEERTGGRVKITIYPSNSLVKANEIYDAVVNNVAQIGFASIEEAWGRFPATEAAMLPFVPWAKDERTSNHLVYNMLKQGYFEQDFEDVVPLGLIAAPPQVMHSNKEQIRTPDDFRGLKMAIAQPGIAKLAQKLGANPSNIPAVDMYQALQKGTVDAISFSWVVSAIFKLHEVSTIHNESPWGIGFLGTVMNKKTYDALPADIKKAIDDVSWEYYSKWTADVDTAVVAGFKKMLTDRKDVIVTFSAADEAKTREMAKGIWADWVKEKEAKGVPAQKLLDAALKISSEYNGWSLK